MYKTLLLWLNDRHCLLCTHLISYSERVVPPKVRLLLLFVLIDKDSSFSLEMESFNDSVCVCVGGLWWGWTGLD